MLADEPHRRELVLGLDADGARERERDDRLRPHALRELDVVARRAGTRRAARRRTRGATGSVRVRARRSGARSSDGFRSARARSPHEPRSHGAHAGPAVAAAVEAAVAGRALRAARPPLVEQELLRHAAAHVVPRQRLERGALTRRLLLERSPVRPRTPPASAPRRDAPSTRRSARRRARPSSTSPVTRSPRPSAPSSSEVRTSCSESRSWRTVKRAAAGTPASRAAALGARHALPLERVCGFGTKFETDTCTEKRPRSPW